jgi:hypothetical protein
MKHPKTIILGILLLAGLELGTLTGCVGYVGARTDGVYYGDGPWFQDGVWVHGGGGWYGHGGGYAHPYGWRH